MFPAQGLRRPVLIGIPPGKKTSGQIFIIILNKPLKGNKCQIFLYLVDYQPNYLSMPNYTLNINGEDKNFPDVPEDMPLLWVIRDLAGLTGTKYGCGQALCGACTIHLDGKPIRSCVLPIKNIKDQKITTIEGISEDGDHPVQEAWQEARVPQCGYCQSGQIMSAVALLESNPNPSDQEIADFMKGNICRCGTYARIREAIKLAAKS